MAPVGKQGAGTGRLGALGGASTPAPPGNKVLSAGAGAFLFSGDTMSPVVDHILPSDAGSFVFTGQAVTLTKTTNTTWDSGAVGAHVVLLGGSLVAKYVSGADNLEGVKATASRSSGDHSYSVIVNANGANLVIIGICNAAASASNFVGVDTNSIGVLNNGQIYFNGGTGAAGPVATYSTGDTVTVRYIVVGGTPYLFFRTNTGDWNNNPSGDPLTGVGGINLTTLGLAAGPYFPMASFYTNNDQVTANFGSW